jgi:hypothetical protein
VVPGVDESVLPAQIRNEPHFVVLAVVLDDQPPIRVEEIRPPNEVTGCIAKLGLNARTWKPPPYQLEPEARLHR